MINGVAFSYLHSAISFSTVRLWGIIRPSSSTLIYSIIALSIPTSYQLHAQTTTTTAKREHVVDYTPAINELLKIGFPDIRNAKDLKYVKINDNQLQWNTRGFSYNNNHAPKNLSGNGFFIPSGEQKKPNRFIFMGGYEFRHLPSKKGNLFGRSGSSDGITRGKVTEADLAKDLEIITKWVHEFTSNNNFKYNHNELYTTTLGYAALAHQAGYQQEATKLIKALFLNHNNPEDMVDTLINLLAEKEYKQCFSDFKKSTDWKTYLQDLKVLQKKFPRGWKNQPGLSILIPLVENKINKVAIIEPKIKGHNFSPEIQKLLQQLLDPPKQNDRYFNTQLFLINTPNKDASAPPLVKLTQHGMDGFIALASLIGDDTLLIPSNQTYANDYYGNSYYHNDDDGISPEQAFASMNKPNTLGSLAQTLISSNLPHNYETLSTLDSDGYRNLAIQWWKEHRNDNRIELIQHYMELGNQGHTNTIINALAQENTDESSQLLEKSILESDKPSSFYHSVQNYVRQRKTKAGDFLTQYIAAIETEIKTDGENRINYQLRDPKQRESLFSALRGFTIEVDPKKLLKKLTENNETLKNTTELLVNAHDGKHLSAYINPIIEIVANKESPKHQYQILSTLLAASKNTTATSKSKSQEKGSFLSRMLKGHKRAQAKKEAAKTAFILTPEQKATWQQLISSTESIHNTNLSAISGILLDICTHPEISNSTHEELYQLGKETADEIILTRANAILKGNKINKLPTADDVSTERYDELINTLEQTEGSLLRKTVLDFTYAERIAISRDERIYAIFQKSSKYISGFAYYNTLFKPDQSSKLEAILNTLIGKEISAKTCLDISTIMTENAELFANITVNIQTSRQLPGIDIYINNYTHAPNPKIDKAEKDLSDGKIKAFTAATYYDRSNGEQTSVIITEDTTNDDDDISNLSGQPNISFSVFNKATLQKHLTQQELTKEERKKIFAEIIKIQPNMESYIDNYRNSTLEQVKIILEQIKQSAR